MNRSLSRTIWSSCRANSLSVPASLHRAPPAIRSAHQQINTCNTSQYAAHKNTIARNYATKSTTSKKTSSTEPGTPEKKTKKSSVKSEKSSKEAKKPAKKTSKKKKVVKKISQRKRVKKPLNETSVRYRKIQELKQQALANEFPKLLPANPFQIFTAENTVGTGYGSIGERMKDTSAKFRNLTASERSNYDDLAKQNKAANKEIIKAWVIKYTPDDIRRANNARRSLNRLAKEPLPAGRTRAYIRARYPLLEDSRLLKRVVTPYIAFVRERWASGDMKNMTPQEAMRTISMEFKNLSTSELDRLNARFEEDRLKYVEEFNRLYTTKSKVKKAAPK